MRIISALALLLIISSCAHNKIRKVRVSPRQVVNVQKDRSTHESNDIHAIDVKAESENNEVIPVEPTEAIDDQNVESEEEYVKAVHRPRKVATSNEKEPKISQDAYNEAFRSELHAKRSKNAFIASFIVVLIPAIGILVSLVFFGIGWGFLNKASRARFITAQGEMYENTARKLWITYLILAGLILLLLAAFLFLFW